MSRRMTPLVLALLVSILACALPGSTDPTDIAEQVEATLSAVPPAAPPATEAPATLPPEASSPEPPAPLRVVYVSGGNVWLWEEGLAPRQLTSSGSAARVLISSDGARVAFLRLVDASGFGHTQLRAVNADGTGEMTLLSAAALDALYAPAESTVGIDISQLAFIPGTHALLFNTYRIPEFIGLMKNDDLLRIDADTGTLTTLLAPESGGNFVIAPDGTQVALTTPTAAGLVNVDGTNLRAGLVTFPLVITYSEYLYYPTPVWAPDSSAVGIALPSEDPLASSPSGTTWLIPADGGSATGLGNITAMFFFPFMQFPALSPSLDQVAYARETGTPNVRDLFIAAPSGASEALVTTGEIDWKGWSPDGAHFLYTVGGPFALHLGTVGAPGVPIVTGADPRWISPTEFLYLEYGGGGATLYRRSIAGASATIATLSGDPFAYDFNR